VNENPNPWLNSEASHNLPPDQLQLDTARYSLTIEEASKRFYQSGVPRSVTTVTRFCRLGDLECIRIDTERNFKWLVDQNSVDKKIKELQQALHFANKSQPDITSYNQLTDQSQSVITSQHESKRETEQPSEEAEWLRGRVEQLEDENIQLKIDKQAREQVINQMNSERKEFIGQLKEMSFQLGETTAKLQQLEAPRTQPEVHQAEPRPPEQVSDAVEVPSEPTPPPAAPATEPTPAPAPPAQAAAEPEKRSFLGRLFGR
jgi:ATP-dependent Lon protease